MTELMKQAIDSIERLITFESIHPSRKDELEAINWQMHILMQKIGAEESSTREYEVGTKLKWNSTGYDYTYRVAIVKKNGILQVKSVKDGIPETELIGGSENLIKTFFKTEAAWRRSLPSDLDSIKVTEPRISNRALKKLCCTPLTMHTDGGRLEELEQRFPGAVMVLSAIDNKKQLVIESMNSAETGMFRIYCKTTDYIAKDFSHLCGSDKPQLMAEWKGLYIDLSHLF